MCGDEHGSRRQLQSVIDGAVKAIGLGGERREKVGRTLLAQKRPVRLRDGRVEFNPRVGQEVQSKTGELEIAGPNEKGAGYDQAEKQRQNAAEVQPHAEALQKLRRPSHRPLYGAGGGIKRLDERRQEKQGQPLGKTREQRQRAREQHFPGARLRQ